MIDLTQPSSFSDEEDLANANVQDASSNSPGKRTKMADLPDKVNFYINAVYPA